MYDELTRKDRIQMFQSFCGICAGLKVHRCRRCHGTIPCVLAPTPTFTHRVFSVHGRHTVATTRVGDLMPVTSPHLVVGPYFGVHFPGIDVLCTQPPGGRPLWSIFTPQGPFVYCIKYVTFVHRVVRGLRWPCWWGGRQHHRWGWPRLAMGHLLPGDNSTRSKASPVRQERDESKSRTLSSSLLHRAGCRAQQK